MTLTKRPKYSTPYGQKDKLQSTEASKLKVMDACSLLEKTGAFLAVEPYEPKNQDLYIGDSPGVYVDIPEKGSQLVVAPDIKCKLKVGDIIWVEVKDKPQRVYHPDTGCDIHEWLSFWYINKYRKEPVLFMFIDPPLDEINLGGIRANVRENFIKRYARFAPEGKPAFYGNWLSHLACYDERIKYPKCSFERSRHIPMKIVYFHVDKMISFASTNALKEVILGYQAAREIPEFRVYYQQLRKVISDPEELKLV
jgi:hypothetical protein